MNDAYYQWPLGAIAPPQEPIKHDPVRRAELHDILDEHFTQKLRYPVIVMSSGQAAISIILRFYKFNRAQTIFVPRWSSHCLWHVTGSYGNPTCTDLSCADIVLAVHRYGFVELCPAQTSQVVIEDSCDSLMTDERYFFPNGADFEVVSLPKIMGVYSGSLLIVRTAELADRIRPLTRDFGPFNEYAGLQRYLGYSGKGPPFCDPNVLEWQNLCPDITMLHAIQDNLRALDRNRETIEGRLRFLASHAPELLALVKQRSAGRLPPVLPVPLRGAAPEGVIVRHVNTVCSLAKPEFAPCALMPLHFGMTDEQFHGVVSKVRGAVAENQKRGLHRDPK